MTKAKELDLYSCAGDVPLMINSSVQALIIKDDSEQWGIGVLFDLKIINHLTRTKIKKACKKILPKRYSSASEAIHEAKRLGFGSYFYNRRGTFYHTEFGTDEPKWYDIYRRSI